MLAFGDLRSGLCGTAWGPCPHARRRSPDLAAETIDRRSPLAATTTPGDLRSGRCGVGDPRTADSSFVKTIAMADLFDDDRLAFDPKLQAVVARTQAVVSQQIS